MYPKSRPRSLTSRILMLTTSFIWCCCLTNCHKLTNSTTQISQVSKQPNRTFTIDYETNTFLKDGKPFRYISGSVHYFRSLPERWDDILHKLRLAGLNAVQTYVEWSSHQPTPAEDFRFDGHLNLIRFIETAQKNNLLVILRPGPFIDAERDMGGLPAWLLWKAPGIELRTSDPDYLFYVTVWYQKLLPMIKPYLYENGGPVIMVQVENEYGSYYACDKKYTSFLRDMTRHYLGDTVALFTTDGSGVGYLKCGAVADVYPTVDFGPAEANSVEGFFNAQRTFAPKGPLVNSEFYPGWLDHWQQPHSQTEAEPIIRTLQVMLNMNASVNFYMFHGGTSFGLTAGSNEDGKSFTPCPTSYDYDAPLTEAGDPTPKYFGIKHMISKFKGVPQEDPVVSPKMALGRVALKAFASMLDPDFRRLVSSSVVEAAHPLSFEELKIGSGFVLYQTTVSFSTTDPALFSAPSLKDRAYVYSGNLKFLGVLSRSEKIYSMPIYVPKGEKLVILVENQGRPCYGSNLNESKGLGSVTLGDKALTNWTMYRIDNIDPSLLNKYATQQLKPNKDLMISTQGGAGFYTGTFTISNNTKIHDTFLRIDGWRKGLAWINNFNIGRYWPSVGPQQTMYVPGSLLRHGMNFITLFELEESPESCNRFYGKPEASTECFVDLVDHHVINGTTPLLTEVKETLTAMHSQWMAENANGSELGPAVGVNLRPKADLGRRRA